MQIITLADLDFSVILDAFTGGKKIGSYFRDGKVQIVRATSHFVLVSHDLPPQKIALKPVRNLNEATLYAKRLLEREKERGSSITVEE